MEREVSLRWDNICINCGKKFASRSSLSKYCGVSCADKYRRKQKRVYYTKNCKICGKEFETFRENVLCCSNECSRENNKEVWKRYRHSEKGRKTFKKWQSENKEKINDRSRKHYYENKEDYMKRALNNLHKRRTVYKITDITKEWLFQLKEGAISCPICGEKMNDVDYHSKKKHLDHIIPINSSCNGMHTMNNGRYICQSCNLIRPKNGSDLMEFVHGNRNYY